MTINCNGYLVDLQTPKVMGILNCTSDSFYDGGTHQGQKNIRTHIEKMIAEGADIIDIGGQSTRPGATMYTWEEEWKNIEFALSYLAENHPSQLFSVDSFWSETQRRANSYGLSIINDISAGTIDDKMLETVADLQKPYILMHMKGTPQNMQELSDYENITVEVNQFLSAKIFELKNLGVNDIILDPGLGFAKTIPQNFELLRNLDLIGFRDYPLLVGVSRKSTIYKTLEITPEKALNGTTSLHMYALMKGANILRVHDVKEAKECITLFELLKNS